MSIKIQIPCKGYAVGSSAAPTYYATLECPDNIVVGAANTFRLYYDPSNTGASSSKVNVSIDSPDGGMEVLFTDAAPTTSGVSKSVTFGTDNWTKYPASSKLTFHVFAVSDTANSLVTAELYAQATQSMAPSFSLGVSPSANIIQGITPVTAVITNAAGKLGAGIASRSIKIGSATSSSASFSITPATSGTLAISATVTDTRGLSTTQSSTVSVTAYSPPSVRSLTIERIDDVGALDPEGTHAQAKVVWENGGSAGGAASCDLKYRAVGASSYTSIGSVESDAVYVINETFSTEVEYEFVATVSDQLASTSKTEILEKAYFTLDFLAGGRGMAVGCASTKEGFECAMPARFVDSVEFAKRGEVFGHMSSLGANITGGAANDTRDFWAAQGNGVAYFSQTGMLNGQPAQYGFLINIVSNNGINGSIVAQEFWWLTEGYHYKRGMNVAGAMPSWIRIFDLGSGALPVANGGTGVTSDAAIGLKAYPVGAVYISYNSTSPASLFGGSWTAITGRFPYFNAGTGTGGSNTHTLTTTEMPSHSHTLAGYGYAWVAAGAANVNANSSSKVGTISCASTGGGGSHNNMPAYQTLYAWRRTG